MKSANRIQCFMLSSILSNNRDVVSLVPVQQMTSSYLCDLTKQVITNVTNAGYTVISIISDNNVVNRKMFMSFMTKKKKKKKKKKTAVCFLLSRNFGIFFLSHLIFFVKTITFHKSLV